MNKAEHILKVDMTTDTISAWKGDALIIGVYDGGETDRGEAQPALAQCGKAVEHEVQKVLKEGWIRGKMGETLCLPIPANSDLLVSRLVLLGMGKKDALTEESFRALGGHISKLCNSSEIKTGYCLLTLDPYSKPHEKKKEGHRDVRALESLAEGAWLNSYRFEHFKSDASKDDKKKQPFRQLFLGDAEKSPPQKQKGDSKKSKPKKNRNLTEIECITRGVAFARNLGNQPGNQLNPEKLAQEARQLADRLPALKTTIYAEKTLSKKGMNGIIAVGGGSASPPRLITMEYNQGDDQPLLAVVGKGITFDSGGISLKPGGSMEEMKFDMCGGAAVFGFMQAIAEMKLPINVVGIVPAAENMPSASAQRPGDIIKTAKGVFVEVINTDAEGRLVLADALHHAASFKPKAIIDLATLTGACVVALGAHASGLIGNDDPLLRKLQKAGEESGERLWPLPFFAEYKEQIKSTVADIKNTGEKGAGTITAACFLSHFVEEKQPWAHIDIAGTAWDTSGTRPHIPKGAVGVGVRLLCRFVQDSWMS